MLFAEGQYSLEAFIEEACKARSTVHLFDLLIRAMGNLGYDRVNVSVLRDRTLDATAHGFGLINTYPQQWQTYYADNQIDRYDPVIRRASGSTTAFRWSDLEAHEDLTRRQRNLLRDAEEAGLYHGIFIPFTGPASLIGGMGLASSVRKAPQVSNLDILTAYGNQFYAVYRRLAGARAVIEPSFIDLTDRELEVLIRVAHGRTNEEIAQVLEMRARTVDFHLHNIFEKLGVKTRAAAVAKAMAAGVFDL